MNLHIKQSPRWAQPVDRADLKARLAHAVDFAVSERERENLCSCALAEIKRLESVIDDLAQIESVSTDQHAVGIAKAALAKVEE